MLWVLPRFGKIRVRIFDQRILVAMPQLLLQAIVPGTFAIVSFDGTL